MRSELELDIRYYETDQMGIVHHSNYIRFFECGRSDMMQKAGLPIEEIEKAGVMLPVISVECRYRHPAYMGDRIRIVSTIDRVPMAKLVVHSEIYNQHDDLLVTGEVVLGFIDSCTRHPVRCPEALAKLIASSIDTCTDGDTAQ